MKKHGFLIPWLLFVGFALHPLTAKAATMCFSIPDVRIVPNGEVTIDLQVTDAETLEAVDATINYPADRLSAVSVAKTTFSQNMSLAANTQTGGVIRIAMAAATGLSGDGELVRITFQAGAASEQPCTIELTEILINDVSQTCLDNGSIIIGTGGPDLVISSVAGPQSGYVGNSLALSCQVNNKGNLPAAAFKVGLYLSKDTTIDPSKDLLMKKVAFSSGLGAGQKKKTTATVTVPSDHAPGAYSIGAIADVDKDVAEDNEANNKKASSKKVQIYRYQDNNGTITDHRTGLTWQAADDGVLRTWPEAKSYCSGLKLGGYGNWRLPTVHELFFVVDLTRFNPAIDPVFDCRASEYWSSTTASGQVDQAWSVNFEGGLPRWSVKAQALGYVRCVRSEP